MDLITLVPHDSGLQLIDGLDLNERGEIAGLGVPPGVPVQNVESQGHASPACSLASGMTTHVIVDGAVSPPVRFQRHQLSRFGEPYLLLFRPRCK